MDFAALCARLLPVDDPPDAVAAVTAVLRASEADELLLIVRQERADDPWSGQVALPGGKAQEGEGATEAAAREIREEAGFDLLEHGRLIGRLAVRSPANRPALVVAPYVALVDGDPPLRPGPEVQTCFWASVAALAEGEGRTSVLVGGRPWDVPGYRIGERWVWGLTYGVVRDLLSLVSDAGRKID